MLLQLIVEVKICFCQHFKGQRLWWVAKVYIKSNVENKGNPFIKFSRDIFAEVKLCLIKVVSGKVIFAISVWIAEWLLLNNFLVRRTRGVRYRRALWKLLLSGNCQQWSVVVCCDFYMQWSMVRYSIFCCLFYKLLLRGIIAFENGTTFGIWPLDSGDRAKRHPHILYRAHWNRDASCGALSPSPPEFSAYHSGGDESISKVVLTLKYWGKCFTLVC